MEWIVICIHSCFYLHKDILNSYTGNEWKWLWGDSGMGKRFFSLCSFIMGMENHQCLGWWCYMCSWKIDLGCWGQLWGLPFLLCQVRMWMGGRREGFKGLLYGKGSRWLCGPEAALCWCRGPPPLNLQANSSLNKSTLCLALLSHPGYFKCGSRCQQLLLVRADYHKERNLWENSKMEALFLRVWSRLRALWDGRGLGTCFAITSKLYQ